MSTFAAPISHGVLDACAVPADPPTRSATVASVIPSLARIQAARYSGATAHDAVRGPQRQGSNTPHRPGGRLAPGAAGSALISSLASWGVLNDSGRELSITNAPRRSGGMRIMFALKPRAAP